MPGEPHIFAEEVVEEGVPVLELLDSYMYIFLCEENLLLLMPYFIVSLK